MPHGMVHNKRIPYWHHAILRAKRKVPFLNLVMAHEFSAQMWHISLCSQFIDWHKSCQTWQSESKQNSKTTKNKLVNKNRTDSPALDTMNAINGSNSLSITLGKKQKTLYLRRKMLWWKCIQYAWSNVDMFWWDSDLKFKIV